MRVFTVFCLLIILSTHIAASQQRVKNVVVFFSFGSNLPAFEKILTGLNATIGGRADEPVNIMTEYLDLSRSANDDYARFIINMYNVKIKEFTVDMLITVGPGVNDAILKYGDSTLKSLPMINLDLDIPGRTTLQDAGIRNGKELILQFEPGKTLQHAFELFPDNKNIYIISGVARLDLFYTSLIAQVKKEFEPAYHFNFISGISLDSTIRFVKTIPQKSIVFVPAYLQDAARVSFSTPEVMELISKNSTVPVFLGITDGGFKGQGGGIGGYLFSYTNLGEEMGRIAYEILNGKQMQDITINDSVFYEYMYDWNELKKWGLTESKAIPTQSTFLNKRISFFSLYKWYMLGILVFILTQTYLIVYLFRLNKRQKRITEKMQVTERMHRELIHTDRLSKMAILTASLSHELFQPLAAIRFTAQAGRQFIQTDKMDSNKASRLFEHILDDEGRATKLIRSVKGMMKSESAEIEKLDLNALIVETVELIDAEAKRDGIKVSYVSEMDPAIVQGDKIQLQQVLMNFIRNAITAMEKKDPQEKILEINLRQAEEEIIVSVRDSGPGLDPLVKDNLFKPFLTTKKEGFGIGLTLCKSLIERHQGKIWAENHPGGGAIFSFSLQMIKNN